MLEDGVHVGHIEERKRERKGKEQIGEKEGVLPSAGKSKSKSKGKFTGGESKHDSIDD